MTRTLTVASLTLLALAGCSSPPLREQVRARCEKDVRILLAHDNVNGTARFAGEEVRVGPVMTRGSMTGTVAAGPVRHQFLCATERRHGDWKPVLAFWQDN